MMRESMMLSVFADDSVTNKRLRNTLEVWMQKRSSSLALQHPKMVPATKVMPQ